jgi:hypothetical protein
MKILKKDNLLIMIFIVNLDKDIKLILKINSAKELSDKCINHGIINRILIERKKYH